MHQARLKSEDFAAEITLRGLTLEERLRLAQPGAERSGKFDNDLSKRGKIWRSWFGGTRTCKGWADFLTAEGVGETELIRLNKLVSSKQKLPAWSVTLRRICDYLQDFIIKADPCLSICENLAAGLVSFAWDELATSPNRSCLRLLSREAISALRQSLRQRLARTGNRASQWEALAAAAGQKLSVNLLPADIGNSHDYFFSSGVSHETLRLLQNYPVLARLWTVQVESWLRFVNDFLRDAAVFSPDGRKIDNRIPIVSRIEADLSDPHEGNRTVMHVQFGKDDEWFYKPRHGRQERAWFELLRWINARGFPRPFRILRVQCEDRHCWMESVRPRRCRNRKERSDYFFRLGAMMCLIHVARGVDFHAANIVPAGDQPVVVDCETLLHPATSLPQYVRAEDDSIVRTGTLTLFRQFRESGSTDWCKTEHFSDDLIAGFRAMHDFLTCRSVVRHLKAWTTQLSKISGRNVYRPTKHYYTMLEGSLAPSRLSSGLDRSLYLCAACRNDCSSQRRAWAEVRALENADIPLFRSKRYGIKIDLSKKMIQDSTSAIRATVKPVARSWSRV
jgi:hypothetical protein